MEFWWAGESRNGLYISPIGPIRRILPGNLCFSHTTQSRVITEKNHINKNKLTKCLHF